MTPRFSPSRRRSFAALGVRWLVLVVFMFGTIFSSVGNMNSHGLAAMGAALHVNSSAPGDTHGHVHGDQGGEQAFSSQIAGADYPHHEADHSHDKSYALPVSWSSAATLPRSWQLLVRPWIEMVQAFRLERPPMG